MGSQALKFPLYDRTAAAPAVESRDTALSPVELRARIDVAAGRLRELGLECVALYADNSIDWIVTDLACRQAGVRLVPIPLFFSAAQTMHTLSSSGAEAMVTDRRIVLDAGAVNWSGAGQTWLGTMKLRLLDNAGNALIPDGTQKITFTSGTTGTPKGVCLSAEQQAIVATSLAATTDLDAPRHLCILPLSTLLENLAGVYAPLLAGGTVIVPPLADVGLEGSSGLKVDRLLASITSERPDSLILVPEILRVLTDAAERSWQPPSSLRFAAVGGGKVSPGLVERARSAGLPVYEGYGLSECASVVCLNVPGADRPGAVGRPLPHVTVAVENGEIVVSGNSFLGYVDQPDSWAAKSVRTGDLGALDADGFLTIDGRAKNQLITSYGRNVAPEWVESELLAGPLLAQAVIFGEARPYCTALVMPADPATSTESISAWIRQVNQKLPDYARVVEWALLPEPLTSSNGLCTENGRPKRTSIADRYVASIDAMYSETLEASSQ